MGSNVTNHLKRQAEAIRKGAELLVESINDWQVIKQYLTNRTKDLELTDIQQQKLNRYNFIYNQLVAGSYTETDVAYMSSVQYKVNIQQSYEDLSCTKELFATLFNFNKSFELHLQLNLNRTMLGKAQEKEDFVAYAMLERNRARLLAMLPQIEQEENWFEAHENIIQFDPALIGAEDVDMKEVLAYINDKRKIKINTELFDEAQPGENDDQAPAL